MLKITKFFDNREGVAAVEFALIAPVIVFLLIGLIDYGVYMNQNMKLENTTRTAAAYLYEGGEAENLADDVYLPGNLGLTDETLDDLETKVEYICECIDGDTADCDLGCADELVDEDSDEDTYMRKYLEVTLTMPHAPLISYPGLSQGLTMTGFVRLQVE